MLLNDKGIAVDDSWRVASSVADWQTPGDVIVTGDTWNLHHDALRARQANGLGKIGLQLSVEEPLDDVSTDLPHLDLIDLKFDKFTDGRAFSVAVLLRRKYAFEGEIRASGDIHRDQLAQLRRVGFNSFSLTNDGSPKSTRFPTSAFSEVYQNAADGLTSVREKRQVSRL